MRYSRFTLIVLLALALATRFAAADPAVVQPYVGERTIAVLRADLTKVNFPELADWLAKSMERANAPKDIIEDFKKDSKPGAAEAQDAINKLTKAGVSDAYLVITLDDRNQPHPIFVIPKPTDLQSVVDLLQEGDLELVKSEGDEVVATERRFVQQAGQIKRADRPELMRGIKGDDSAMTMSMSLSDPLRNSIEQMVPNLPPQLGGQPITVLTDGMRQMLLNVATPPQPSVRVQMKAKDAQAAEALKAFIEKQAGQAPDEAKGLVELVMPKVDGDTLTLDLPEPALDQLVAKAVPAIIKAREQAKQVSSMSNMRQLMIGLIMHANDNRGKVPESLDAALQVMSLPDQARGEVLTNPAKPELGDKGYVYVKPSEATINQIQGPSERLAIYEAGDFGSGKNVAFWDGHVEFIKDEAKFNQLKQAAGAK